MNWLQCLLLLGFGFSWAVAIPSSPKNPATTELNWPNECKSGPQYWCQNLLSAKDCGALDHCAQTVWMHQSLNDVDDSSACKTCVDYITGFKNITSRNNTAKQLEIVLSALCLIIPESLISKECDFVVKESVPYLQKYVKEINPHTFCKTIFICNAATASKEYFKAKNITIPSMEYQPISEKETTELAPKTKQPKQKLDCSGCYTLVTTGQKLFKKASRDEVLNRMLELCGELSSFSDLCSANVITYFPTIYHHLDSVKVGDACHVAGACDELYHFHEPTVSLQSAIDNAPDEANDEVCDFCLAMVHHLRDIVIANSTELEFKQVMEGICRQTGNFKDQCLQLVEQYYELIYQFLVNELDPKEVCSEVKLCVPKTVSMEVKSEFPLWPVVPSTVDLDEALMNETSLLTRVKLHKSPVDFSRPLTLLGAERCTWGPSYWCINMTTSKECGGGTLKHCIHQVWEKMDLKPDNGDICKICKDMVKQARDQLNSNETQEELRQVFEGSCKLIPIKVARKECIVAVDDFVPELVETLSSQMNPQIVCATVGLCNSARMDLLLELAKTEKDIAVNDQLPPLPLDRMFPKLLMNKVPQKEEIENRGKEACEICELTLHFVQQQITLPKSEEEIKSIVHNVCVKLPHNVATECSSFVEIYGDAFIALLAQEVDPSVVCPRIGACISILAIQESPVGDMSECKMCLNGMESILHAVGDDKSEVNIKKHLDVVCKDLPHKWDRDCQHFIKKMDGEITDSIIAGLTSHETCVYSKLCLAKDVSGIEKMITPPIIPRIEVNGINEIQASNNKTLFVGSEKGCVLCEFIMSKLEDQLRSKKTDEEIKNGVLTICDHMPASVKPQCKKFCSQYADMIIGLLTYSLNPEEVCSRIHLCHHSNNTEPEKTETSFNELEIESVQAPKHEIDVTVGDNRCVLCEFIMTKLDKELKDKNTTEEIKKVVNAICEHMPHTVKPECKQFVKQYADLVIDLLAASLEPKEICSALHLCPNTTSVNERKTSDCVVCEALIGALQGLSSDRNFINVFHNELFEACEKLPEKYQEVCDNLVIQLAPQIEAIAHTIPSRFICSHLKICDNHYQNVETLNSEGCIQGPQFWCASTVHAASCGVSAIEHCQQHVWKSSKPMKNAALIRKMLIAPSN